MWIGDGFCDDNTQVGHHLNCAALNNDGGDCANGNAAEYVVDCLGHRAPLSWFGDGACDSKDNKQSPPQLDSQGCR